MFNHRLGAVVALVSCVLLLPHCRSRTTNPEIYTPVSGTVTDSVTALPIADARVFFQDTIAYTHPAISDSLGEWRHSFLGGGPAVYYCMKDGYSTKSLIVQTTSPGQHIAQVNFRLVLK